MNAIVQDVRFALRRLRKSPGFAVLAVVTLALGIGLNSAVFSVVDAVALRPLPVETPGELASLYTESLGGGFTHGPVAFPDYLDLKEQAASFEDLAAHALSGMIFEHGGESQTILGEMATGNFFTLLGVRPHVGRLFNVDDDRTGDPQAVAVLSHRTYERRFGGTPDVIGSTIRLNGHPFTVVGVAQQGFYGLSRGLAPELWVPMRTTAWIGAQSIANSGEATPGLEKIDDRAQMWHWMIGRLRRGTTFDAAGAELSTLAARLQQIYPETNEKRSFLLVPTSQVRILPGVDGPVVAASFVVMGLVSLVLLIACANVANMFLARAVERRKEIATRLALGASRTALVRQLLAESLSLAFVGGGLGLALAHASNCFVDRMPLPIPIDLTLGLQLDLRVLGFTFTAATLTAVLFGLAPAFEATRTNLTSALREESRGSSTGVGGRRLRSALVVGEVALSLLLLVCAGLSVRSMQNAHRINPGFEPAGVVSASFSPDRQGYTEPQSRDFYRRLTSRLEAAPGVRSATTASHLPLTLNISMERVARPGEEALPTDEWPMVDTATVGAGYFKTLGIPVLSGRGFTQSDTEDSPRVAVVNQTLAERFWPGEDAVGRRLRVDERDGTDYEIVAVVANGKYRTLGEEPRPFIYRSLEQRFLPALEVLVKTEGDPRAALSTVRQYARELDPNIAVADLSTVEEAISASLLLPRLSATLFGVFGLIGLALAAVGLYGVISYAVSQRTHEIGIRMAMGARRRDVLAMVVKDGLVLTGMGLALGLGAAALVTRALESVLYGISSTDLVTFVGVSLVLTAIAMVASLVPARRASTVDPLTALRYE